MDHPILPLKFSIRARYWVTGIYLAKRILPKDLEEDVKRCELDELDRRDRRRR